MNGDPPIICMQNLSKRFGKVQALDHVDLAIRPGSIIGLLGANGAGKSTLLRHIIGLYLPDSGECTTFDVASGRLTPLELARIGCVHQEGELLQWMTVRQLIRFVSTYYPDWNHELEDRYVADFGICLTDRVGSLSPGQRQKLAILLAIGFEPELLILDEPAAALDPIARARFLDLLLNIIQDDKRTIIISSHILSDVEKVIDHVLIMQEGRMLRDESFDDIRERFAKVTLTSLNGPLPEKLPFEGIRECRREGGRAVLVLEDFSEARFKEKVAGIRCEAVIQPLSLEEIYQVVVGREREAS